LVGLLRQDSERPVLADIRDLVGNARRSGLEVELTVAGNLDAVAADTGETAYRIVQEALTNVLRHSGTHAAAVDVHLGDAQQVAIVDAGSDEERVTEFVEGNGVKGIRERVAAVSGTVQIGRQSDGHWLVNATLPLSSAQR
jgi:signal transduction histidine kinase